MDYHLLLVAVVVVGQVSEQLATKIKIVHPTLSEPDFSLFKLFYG